MMSVVVVHNPMPLKIELIMRCPIALNTTYGAPNIIVNVRRDYLKSISRYF